MLLCRTLATNVDQAFFASTLEKSKKLSLKSIIIECVGVLSTSARDRIHTWTSEFIDKTPQIAEEQLVMTTDKIQETKLQRYKS